jgi:hypothetical protein
MKTIRLPAPYPSDANIFFPLTFKTPSFMNEPTSPDGVNPKCHAVKAATSVFLAFSAFLAGSA